MASAVKVEKLRKIRERLLAQRQAKEIQGATGDPLIIASPESIDLFCSPQKTVAFPTSLYYSCVKICWGIASQVVTQGTHNAAGLLPQREAEMEALRRAHRTEPETVRFTVTVCESLGELPWCYGWGNCPTIDAIDLE